MTLFQVIIISSHLNYIYFILFILTPSLVVLFFMDGTDNCLRSFLLNLSCYNHSPTLFQFGNVFPFNSIKTQKNFFFLLSIVCVSPMLMSGSPSCNLLPYSESLKQTQSSMLIDQSCHDPALGIPSLPSFPGWNYRQAITPSGIQKNCGCPNSCPHACMAKCLITEPSPQAEKKMVLTDICFYPLILCTIKILHICVLSTPVTQSMSFRLKRYPLGPGRRLNGKGHLLPMLLTRGQSLEPIWQKERATPASTPCMAYTLSLNRHK